MGERNVEVFSITDHDALSAYSGFVAPPGTRVVTGIEINTTYGGNEVHILGFGMPLDSPRFNAMIERNRTERRVRVEKMVDRLRRAGYGIALSDVLAEAPNAKALGRPHVGMALIRKGFVADIDSAFRNLLRLGKPGFVPSTHITPHEAIAHIAQDGGVAVLAHPGRLRDRGIIDELAAEGLHGLEVFYPQHDAADVASFRAIARRYGMIVTGGSDFHDIRYHRSGVGMQVPDDEIAPFLERVL